MVINKSNVVASWSYSDGAYLTDDSGNNHTLTNDGSTQIAGGLIGKGASFDGTNDEQSVADHADFDGTANFSISMWLKGTFDGVQRSPISKWTYQTAASWSMQMWGGATNNKLQFFVADADDDGGNNTVSSNVVLSADTWYHVVMVYDGSQSTNTTKVKFYINGTLDTSMTSGGAIPTALRNSNTNLIIGDWGGSLSGRNWNGDMDEIVLWKGYVLSSSEVTELYNGGAGYTYPFTSVRKINGIILSD